MNELMRNVRKTMSIYMGVTVSFVLSLVGNLSSGHFTLPGFLMSFVVSTILALLIGRFVPMGKITSNVMRSKHLEPGKPRTKAITSCISDLIYTPVITLAMVFLAYRNAVRQGAPVKFLGMFLPSLLLSLVVGFVLIYVLESIFMNIAMKKAKGQ